MLQVLCILTNEAKYKIKVLGKIGLHGRVKLVKKTGRAPTETAGAWMDMERKKLQAYEYLCHVGEAKE